MSANERYLKALRDVTQRAQFNNWLGLEVASASEGEFELHLVWRRWEAGIIRANLAEPFFQEPPIHRAA